jgi:putative colanic acid biosynthesis UDP-glucose lipid carrier transferase
MNIRSHGNEFAIAYRLIDMLIILGVAKITSVTYLESFSTLQMLAALVAMIVFLLVAESSGLYRSWRTYTVRQQMLPVFLCWAAVVVTLLIVAYSTKSTAVFSRIATSSWLLLVPITLCLWRVVLNGIYIAARRRGFNRRKAIIVGATKNAKSLIEQLRQHENLGIDLVGVVDDRVTNRLSLESLPTPFLGEVNNALALAKSGDIDHVYIAMPMKAEDRIVQYLKVFSDSTVNTYVIPDFFVFNLIQSRLSAVGNVPLLSVHDTPFYGFATWIKRLQDIVISSLIILFISPVLLAVAIGVKVSSPGPIIFKQKRYGLDGRQIKVWKFRSMRVMDNGTDVKQATKNDPRVTRFGAFIRRTSLDELPQFFNVLQGRMSIVGPRPHAVAHNEEYRAIVDRYMLRHKVKPGITGLAQISGYRGETDTVEKMEKRVEFDLRYIETWSTILDLKIIFLTVFKGFVGKAAY